MARETFSQNLNLLQPFVVGLRVNAGQTEGYTCIAKVLFTLDGNDKGLRGHSKKICKPRFNTDIRKYFFLKSSH